jgi:hypothetical protein
MSRSVVSATDEDRRLVADALDGTAAGSGERTDVP